MPDIRSLLVMHPANPNKWELVSTVDWEHMESVGRLFLRDVAMRELARGNIIQLRRGEAVPPQNAAEELVPTKTQGVKGRCGSCDMEVAMDMDRDEHGNPFWRCSVCDGALRPLMKEEKGKYNA